MYRKLCIGIFGINFVFSLCISPLYGQTISTDPNQMNTHQQDTLSLAQTLAQSNQDLSAKNFLGSSQHLISDFITMMFDTHPNIKMYQQMIKGAEASVDGAMWSYFPTPTLGTNYTTKNIDGTTIAIEQPLWTGGKLDAAYDMAIANKDASQFSLKENGYLLVETLLNTIQTYLKAKEDLVALHNGKDSSLALKR